MSKKYFQCPDHGPIDADDIVIPEPFYGDPFYPVLMLHKDCGKVVSEIPGAWVAEPMSEKARAFLWASAVTLFVLALYFLYRNFERSTNLPPFTLDALKHWRLPW